MAFAERALANPPIKEAIFAISFKEPIPLNELESFCTSDFIKNKFPIQEKNLALKISRNKDGGNVHSPKENYLLKCNDSCNKSIQINSTQVSYHNFNRYAGWEEMLDELKSIWAVISLIAKGLSVSNLSVRYINELQFPIREGEKLSEYINLLPQLPESFKKRPINDFFLQVKIPDQEHGLQGIVTETILPSSTQTKVQFLLDLQVIKRNMQSTDNEIWDSFLSIRNFKNELFFNCITEKGQNLYNHV